jgi:hypothetical protein
VSELCAFYQNELWLSVCIAKVIGYSQSLGLLNAKTAFEGFEPCDGKLSLTVLRGKGGRKAPALPGGCFNVKLPFGFRYKYNLFGN